jgi:dipeptidyl aminopeptidase/acylaminoacyl peptidase
MTTGAEPRPDLVFSPEAVASGVDRTEVTACAGGIYWLEHSFDEGRSYVMHSRTGGGTPRAATPERVDVGTLAWEYGGGSYLVCGSFIVYSDRSDQRLYRVEAGGSPIPLSPVPPSPRALRFADGAAAPDGTWAVYVQEAHAPGAAVEHALVAVALTDAREPRTLARGQDFYASPCLSPDGRQLAWISWDKPRMPWDGTELWLADVAADLTLANARMVAGGPTESVLQPAFSPSGSLHWASDRSGWWNLYVLDGGSPRELCAERAEFAAPLWQHGRRSYCFLTDGAIVAVRIRDAVHELVRIGPESSRAEPVARQFTSFAGPHVSSHAGTVAFAAATPVSGVEVLTLDMRDRRITRVAGDVPLDQSSISVPAPISIRGADGSETHGFWYEPTRPRGGDGRAGPPPLILHLHGGPTDSARLALDAELQLWTSRGFALLDLNYSGSSGFGSAYRHRLDGEWGARDLEDCSAAVRQLVDAGMVDSTRVFARGASAGGYLTLQCVTATTLFRGGMARCGIADLALWREDTHDFESRYTDVLVGPPTAGATYAARSPARNVGERSAPLLLIHGLVDTVVPPEHSRLMAERYAAAGRPSSLVLLPDEPHGLRRYDCRLRWLAAELSFVAERGSAGNDMAMLGLTAPAE